MNKKKDILMITISLFLVVCVLLFYLNSYKQKNIYHRNRMIELQYLNKLVNDSKCKFNFFKNKWNDKFHQQHAEYKIYIIDNKTTLLDPYFTGHEYAVGKTDFYGYQFEFDSLGNLIGFSLYKP